MWYPALLHICVIDGGKNDMLFWILLVLFLVFAVIYVNVIIPYKKEKEYILREMDRAIDDVEYMYWKKELRRLYLIGLFKR